MPPAMGRQPGPPVPTPKKVLSSAPPPATAAVPRAALPVRKRRRPGVFASMRRGTTKSVAIVSTTISPIARIRPPTALLAEGTSFWSVSPMGKALGASPMKES